MKSFNIFLIFSLFFSGSELLLVPSKSKMVPTYFKISKIFPNPNSNPYNIITSISIPDTVNFTVSISKGTEQIVEKKFTIIEPGEYTFSWEYKNSNYEPGIYKISFILNKINSNTVSYSSNMDIYLFH